MIVSTGVLLSISPKVDFLQPSSRPLPPGISLSFDQILAKAKTVPEAQIQGWEDVAQVDARPAAGIVRVRAYNYWEIQIDGQTGEVIRAAPRWKTLLVLVHDGSWFAPWVKSWLFFPTGLLALALWFTGMMLWYQRAKAKRKRR